MRAQGTRILLRLGVYVSGRGQIVGEVALCGMDGIGVLELQYGKGTAAVPGAAQRLADLFLFAAAASQGRDARAGFLAVEVLAQDYVHHTAPGIGTVDR